MTRKQRCFWSTFSWGWHWEFQFKWGHKSLGRLSTVCLPALCPMEPRNFHVLNHLQAWLNCTGTEKRAESRKTPHYNQFTMHFQSTWICRVALCSEEEPPIQNPPASELSLNSRKSRGEHHQYLSWRVNLALDEANLPQQLWLLSIVEKIFWRENVLYFKCICFVFQMHLNSYERPCKAGCLLNLSTRDCFSLQIKIRTELNPGIWVNLQ